MCENNEKPARPGVGDTAADFPLKGVMPLPHLELFL